MTDTAADNRPAIEVLFVDDDTAVARSISRCLARVGFVVRVAHSGAEALAAVTAHRPDVIVTDHQMPYMSGADLIGQLIALDPSLRSRIILTSGDLQEDATRVALDQTGCRSIAKPYSAGELALAIRAMVAGRSRLTAA